MLKIFGLKNVRSFKKLKDFEFKPITILCGTNSSGKSTILKSLLLWKQSLENISTNRKNFVLNGKYTNLGSHVDFLYNKAKNNIMEINFQFEVKREKLLSWIDDDNPDFSEQTLNLLKHTISEKDENSADYINLDFTLSYAPNESPLRGIDIKKYILKITPIEATSSTTSRKKTDSNGTNSKTMELKISLVKSGKYKFEWKNIAYRGVKDNSIAAGRLSGILQRLEKGELTIKHRVGWELFFDTFISINEYFGTFDIEFLKDEEDEFVLKRIATITNLMRNFLAEYFNSISYIGPLREEPARRYLYDDVVTNIGVKGENSAFIFNNERNHNVDYMSFNPTKDIFERNAHASLGEATIDWLNKIGISGFGSEKNEELYKLSIAASKFNEKKVNIADVGFGVSQVVPIVIEGLKKESGESLILEQPEIHLHPKMQMKLADFILSLALSGKKVIIETHSEHIINRFVRRIVEDNTGEFNSLIGINFIKNSADGSINEKVNLSETNGIVNWPEEFFDQAAEEQQKIMNAIINKKMESKK